MPAMLARPMLRRSVAFLGPALWVAAATGCQGGEGDPDHGYVKLIFQRVVSEDASPYTGTTQADIQLSYESCLLDFYAANPNWLQDGVDGAEVFASFADPESDDDLCSQKDPGRATAECTVASIDQRIEDGRLRVVYDISDSDMQGKVLFFGPLPCEKLAGCRPIVSMTGGSALGRSGQTQIWHHETVENPQAAACEPGAPIEINSASDVGP
ncbi:MAG: hypothetical protein D6705_04220 [Deltaproteobacteria bacterium]|nr:MAG: hypothetical protein D6705_04220 [Deltaproteobacteria bacterium]